MIHGWTYNQSADSPIPMPIPARWTLMLAVLGCALLCSAQRPDPCLERRILVVPTASGFRPATEFSMEQIRGEVHGKPVSVVGLSPFAGRRRTVVLLDASGSMKSRWAAVLAITANLIKSSPTMFPSPWLAIRTRWKMLSTSPNTREATSGSAYWNM